MASTDNSRVTNLAGVYIESITVQGPPFDQPGVVQEFVGEGVIRDFMFEPASEVTDEVVKDFFEENVNRVAKNIDRVALKYNLLIRARTGRGARAKSRAYVRGVNPFSARVTHIESIDKTSEFDDILSEVDPLSNFYKATLFVAK